MFIIFFTFYCNTNKCTLLETVISFFFLFWEIILMQKKTIRSKNILTITN